jgi:hypothetical protein
MLLKAVKDVNDDDHGTTMCDLPVRFALRDKSRAKLTLYTNRSCFPTVTQLYSPRSHGFKLDHSSSQSSIVPNVLAPPLSLSVLSLSHTNLL